MIWFWFVVIIAVVFICATAAMLRRGRWLKKEGRGYDPGFGWFVGAGVCAVVPVILTFIVVGVTIDRHVSEQVCAKKDSYSTSEYRWVDYHFFSYECMLITPSGNITEIPVLPIENVGGDR